MGLSIDDVSYCINDHDDVPEIYIKDELAIVVSCSTQYATKSDKTGIKLLIASFYLESERKGTNELKLHNIFVNKITSEVFCS